MKPTKVLTYAVAVIVIIILIFNINPNSSTAPGESNYKEELAQHRAKRHEFMQSNPVSPFVEQGVAYDSLKYFPVNETFKVKASVEEIKDGEIHKLATSDGKIQNYQEVAILHFDLKDTHQDLSLLKSMDDGQYFLPFYDETSAISTYGSGRYLEVDYEPGDSRLVLDFNYAHNPYCAYTTGYSCPVPPQKNNLTVAIESGEKNYD
jgi:uncharacterized protein (DUF1684 family)